MKIIGLFALALLLAPSSSFAFVQTQTCSESGTLGQIPCAADETPRPVQWGSRCVTYYVHEAGSADLDNGALSQSTLDAVQRSFASWNDVSTAGIRIDYAGETNEDRATFLRDSANANVLIWRDETWPYASRRAFAITSVTFSASSGIISDADIEFNGEIHRFTSADTNIIVDLENTLTHEAGHFLGLDHTPIMDATMAATASTGETMKRTLHADDIEGVATIYPASTQCDQPVPTPSFFEKPTGDDGCCATSGTATPPLWIIALALIGAALRRSRE